MRFVFDECISDRIPRALQVLGKDTHPYHEHWPRGEKDIVWMPRAFDAGWVIVTSDFFQKPHERAALRQHKGRVVLLATRNLRFWQQVRLVINRWEAIEKAPRRRPPFICRFTIRSNSPQDLVV